MEIITGRIKDVEELADGRLHASINTRKAGRVTAYIDEALADELGPGAIVALVSWEADGHTYYAIAHNTEEVVGAMNAGSNQGKAPGPQASPSESPAALVVATYMEIADRLIQANADPTLVTPTAIAALTRQAIELTRPPALDLSARPPSMDTAEAAPAEATPATGTPATSRNGSRPARSRSAQS